MAKLLKHLCERRAREEEGEEREKEEGEGEKKLPIPVSFSMVLGVIYRPFCVSVQSKAREPSAVVQPC